LEILISEATIQLKQALAKLGRASYRVEGFLSKPHGPSTSSAPFTIR